MHYISKKKMLIVALSSKLLHVNLIFQNLMNICEVFFNNLFYLLNYDDDESRDTVNFSFSIPMFHSSSFADGVHDHLEFLEKYDLGDWDIFQF
mgnify:CR=1 FL=1